MKREEIETGESYRQRNLGVWVAEGEGPSVFPFIFLIYLAFIFFYP